MGAAIESSTDLLSPTMDLKLTQFLYNKINHFMLGKGFVLH